MAEPTSWIVLYDFPSGDKSSRNMFYRRLHELLTEQGGSARCRATKSAYVVEGNGAMSLAYAIAQLASHFGAGKVGEQDGVIVLPLGTIDANTHWEQLQAARRVVDNLTADRRTRDGKRKPRSIVAATEPVAQPDTAIPWEDLSAYLEAHGARDMAERHAEFDALCDREDAAALGAVVLDEAELPW